MYVVLRSQVDEKGAADQQGPEVNGRIFELGGGFVSEVRYERNEGVSPLAFISASRSDGNRSQTR